MKEKMLMYLIFSISILSVIKHFKTKLYTLLSLELMMILCIKMNLEKSLYGFMNSFLSLFLTVLMVVDSTFGLSILMSSSRSSEKYFKQFDTI